jgi:hypothetical protein
MSREFDAFSLDGIEHMQERESASAKRKEGKLRPSAGLKGALN